jgi:hypothetical protein
MNSPNLLHERTSELAEAARIFQTAAGQPAVMPGRRAPSKPWRKPFRCLAPPGLSWPRTRRRESFERRRSRASEAASWLHVDGLSREEEILLRGTLHDVGAAFARCARACRHGRSRLDRSRGAEVSWLEVPDRPAKSAA